MNEFVIHEHMSFDWLVVTYFFLGGLSAGSYFLSVAASFWKKSLKPLAVISGVISPLAVIVGMIVLMLFDLVRPLGFWRLLVTFVPTSSLFWGVWALSIFLVISSAHLLMLIRYEDEKARVISFFGLPFALVVGTYTAVLLNQAPGRVLWHSPLLTVLFPLGGIISAIALVMLIAVMTNKSHVSAHLNKLLAGLIGFELIFIVLEVLNLYNGGTDSVEMVNQLVSGGLSVLFWAFQITAGIVIPFIILVRSRVSPSLQAVASILILVGIFTMRYIVVVGGQMPTF